VPKSVNLKSPAMVVNMDEEGVAVVGGVGGAAREVLVMLFSMDRNEGHVVAFTMLLLSGVNLYYQKMHPPKVCLFLFKPQYVGGRSWKRFLGMHHLVSYVHIE
jgi:hypothetical protein